jgi:hypothetical protein
MKVADMVNIGIECMVVCGCVVVLYLYSCVFLWLFYS